MKINPSPTADNLGGKGYQLHRLSTICDVPQFFVVKFDKADEIEDEQTQAEILAEFEKNKFDLVSVRSSATVEDGASSSFAGIFESVLNVDKGSLIEKIKQVLDSVKSERVKQYCELKDIGHKQIGMRVIVQRMVNAKTSGVVFTKLPNKENEITIETVFGLGEQLVSGQVTPDNYTVNRESMKVENIVIKDKRKLNDKQITELAKLSLQIEKSLNFNAADIEWAIDQNGKLFILQARSVTGLDKSEYDKFLELKNSHEWKSLVTRHSTILDRE